MSDPSFAFEPDHDSSPNLGSPLVHHEMWLAEEAIFKITGAYPTFVRPRKKLIAFILADIDYQTDSIWRTQRPGEGGCSCQRSDYCALGFRVSDTLASPLSEY